MNGLSVWSNLLYAWAHKDPWAALGAVHLFQKEDTRCIEQAAGSCAMCMVVVVLVAKERKGRNKRTRTAFYIDWDILHLASAQTTLS